MLKETSPLVTSKSHDSNETVSGRWQQFQDDIAILKTGPKSLWVLYAISFMYGFGYFLSSIMIVLLFTEDFDLSDFAAGLVYAVKGVAFALAAVLEGSIPDKFGIRMCLIAAGVIVGIGCIVVATAPNVYVAMIGVVVFLPLGTGLSLPVTKVGVKKYTLPAQRSCAYSLLYVSVHGSSAFSAVLVDIVTTLTDDVGGISANRFLILIGAIVAFATSILGYFLHEIDYEETAEQAPNVYHEDISYCDMMERVSSRYAFKILTYVVLILVCVKSGYRQLDLTFPRYMKREMGDDAHFGFVLAVHPVVLVISAIGFSPLVYKVSAYNLIVIGSLISSGACFILMLGTSYVTTVAFIVVISLGEGMWNPRLYDYTLSLAPKGMEGTFMALASSPLFLSTVLAGIMSGLLMWSMCGDLCGLMWAVIGAVSLLTPVTLLLLQDKLKLNTRFLDMPRK